MIYSEPYTGSDCLFPDPVFGFLGRSVHRYKNNCFKGLFLQNNRFTHDFILQFNGVLLITFFDTYFRWFFSRNRLQMPLVADYCDHVGEISFWQDLYGFLVSREGFYFGEKCVPGFFKRDPHEA
jgi:hypothetical protein